MKVETEKGKGKAKSEPLGFDEGLFLAIVVTRFMRVAKRNTSRPINLDGTRAVYRLLGEIADDCGHHLDFQTLLGYEDGQFLKDVVESIKNWDESKKRMKNGFIPDCGYRVEA